MTRYLGQAARRGGALVLIALSTPTAAFAQTPPAPSQTPKRPAGKTAKPKPLADSLSADAKADYTTGKVLFNDGDFAGALIKFEAALTKSNDPRLLWNMAACEKNLRHYAKVLALLARYKKEGGALLTKEDVQDTDDLAAALDPFTARVTLNVNEADAEVFVDDEKVGTSPLAEPVVMDVGMRHVRVTKAGFRPHDASVPVGGAKTATIDVKLEREGGHLKVAAPANATVLVDDKVVGQGPQDIALAAGGHELRVTAPKMRAFQTDVTIGDNETRAIDVALEAAAAGAAPELWVAVGCDTREPRAPEEGLTVYLDGSATATAPLRVQKSWKDDAKRDVVDYVAYPTTAGRHTALVRFPGCEPMQTPVAVVEGRPSGVYGVLRPDVSFFSRGPAGYPDWFRIAAGIWSTTTTYGRVYDLLLSNVASRDNGGPSGSNDQRVTVFNPTSSSITLAGPALSLGLVGRWLTLLLDLRYASGSTTGSAQGAYFPQNGNNVRPFVGTLDGAASIHALYAGVRPGAKIPLYYGSISGGPGAAFLVQSISSDSYGSHGEPGFYPYGWVAADVQPLCDFGIQGLLQGGPMATQGEPKVNVTWVLSAFYQPNRRCQREQAGLFTVRGSTR